MPLTDTQIRQARPKETPYKLPSENGMHLLVQPTGGKLWRLNYRFEGKHKTLALGSYPDVGLAAARKLRDKAREQIAAGLDPAAARKAEKRARKLAAENSFEAVARSWWSMWKANRTEGTAQAAIRALEIHVFPKIGSTPITSIEPADILDLLRPMEAKGITDMLKRTRARIAEIFTFAIANGVARHNPAEGLHRAVTPHVERHRAALRATDLREFFIRLDAVRISALIKCAIRLQVLTFVRPGELRCALWDEFDLDAAVWTVPAERDRARGLTGMKMREEHIVPLSRQALAVLDELRAFTGGHDLLFPNRNGQGRPMSDGTVNSALRAMGYAGDEVSGAGFRATATGALLEMGYRPDVIDRQLAHRERKQVFAAYSHHAQFLPERKAMMQAWGDYIEAQQRGNVIPIRGDDAA